MDGFSEATMAVEGKLPTVPETILKRRKRQAKNRTPMAKEAVKSKVGLLTNRIYTRCRGHVSPVLKAL